MLAKDYVALNYVDYEYLYYAQEPISKFQFVLTTRAWTTIGANYTNEPVWRLELYLYDTLFEAMRWHNLDWDSNNYPLDKLTVDEVQLYLALELTDQQYTWLWYDTNFAQVLTEYKSRGVA